MPTKPSKYTRRPWTEADIEILRKNWGCIARLLRQRLNRSDESILKKAQQLGLEKPSQGMMTRAALARELGVDNKTITRLLIECGTRERSWAPVHDPRRGKEAPWVGFELDAVRLFLQLRDTKTVTAGAWGERQKGYSRYGMAFLAKNGLDFAPGRGNQARLPEKVFDELLSGQPGRWCLLWKTILGLPADEISCNPWFLALVASDMLDDYNGWALDYAPEPVKATARRILAVCRDQIFKMEGSDPSTARKTP